MVESCPPYVCLQKRDMFCERMKAISMRRLWPHWEILSNPDYRVDRLHLFLRPCIWIQAFGERSVYLNHKCEPEWRPLISLLVFHLFFQRKLHCFFTHVEHIVGFLGHSMILQALKQGKLGSRSRNIAIRYILPKAKLCRSLPEPSTLLLVICFDKLVIDHDEGVDRYVIRKRWKRCNARHNGLVEVFSLSSSGESGLYSCTNSSCHETLLVRDCGGPK